MAVYTKKRGIPSQAVHFPCTSAEGYHQIGAYAFSHNSYRFAKDSILTIIAILMLLIIGVTLYCFIATPEYIVKQKVEDIAKDYYENYHYNSILKHNSLSEDQVKNPESAKTALKDSLEHYEEAGFATVTLRQLLLYDNRKHAAATSTLAKYCDLDRTLIKIYPESPFTRNSYHVNYTYSYKF